MPIKKSILYGKFSAHNHNILGFLPPFLRNSGDMGFLGILIQVTCVAVIFLELAAAAVALPIALPGCPDRCGDVEIPYPFGLREGCYIDRYFYVNCSSNSSGKTQPLSGTITVTKISLQGQMDILMYIAHDCYEHGVRDITSSAPWLKSYHNFSVSNTQNKFVVVGCDTYAYLGGFQQNESYTTGCTTACGSTRYMVDGFCSGVGCCEQKRRVQFFCWFPYQSTGHKMMPMVLDWTIGTESCNEDAENRCGGNSTCYNSDTGYRCKCKDGYHGNPYLPQGCQDINECENPNNCNLPGQKCINGLGNFTCFCFKGYHLDRSAGVELCVTNQSKLNRLVLVGKYIYCIAPLHVSVNIFLWNLL
ncbi:wall-associated receptor kinase 2 [Quercus suber]|uniref:wall-associated receptor kinase 2 n=1 Tax=Quercus suber TaxID=58331 RepID=UPI0032DE89AA